MFQTVLWTPSYICLFIRLSICLSFCSSAYCPPARQLVCLLPLGITVCQSFYVSTTCMLFVYLSVCPSICTSIRPSVHPSMCLSISLSVCLPVCLSVSLFFYLHVCLSTWGLSVCISKLFRL